MGDAGTTLLALLLICTVAYFAPTIRAYSVNHIDKTSILLLNVFLGWLGIPWVIALVWSFRGDPATREPQPVYKNGYLVVDEPTKRCPFCAEEIKAAAIKCKHCQSDLSENPVLS
jgi:hypothetical protein